MKEYDPKKKADDGEVGKLDVNVVVTDPNSDETNLFIDLQLSIQTKIEPQEFLDGLKKAIITYMTQHGDTYEFGE